MSHILKVVIVLSRCQRRGDCFGIRFEDKSRDQWVADWAFPVKERNATREKFDRSAINGSFEFARDYPGCPSCGAAGAFRCACGRVACWDTDTKQVKCPWCGQTVNLGGIVDQINAGGDV